MGIVRTPGGGGFIQGAIILGGNCPVRGGIIQGAISGGQLSGGQLSRGGIVLEPYYAPQENNLTVYYAPQVNNLTVYYAPQVNGVLCTSPQVNNLTVYYAPQVKSVNKTHMVNIVKTISQVHDVSQNNIIIGDFNFADKDVDKGKGKSDRDKMMNSSWEEFKSETTMVGPFRV